MRKIQELGGIDKIDKNDITNLAYASQEAVFDTLIKKLKQIILNNKDINSMLIEKKITNLVICGGVSANKRLSQKINELVSSINKKLGTNISIVVPSLQYTTDNGAMIAKVGCLYWQKCRNENVALGNGFGYSTNDLSFSPRARWRIDEIKARSW